MNHIKSAIVRLIICLQINAEVEHGGQSIRTNPKPGICSKKKKTPPLVPFPFPTYLRAAAI